MTTRRTFKRRVRERQAKHRESYATARKRVADAATSTVEVRKAFRRMAEDMRAGRAAWMPGPKMDLDTWLALPIVPTEGGVETPTIPLLVVEVGALDCPVRDLLARGVLRKSDLAHPDEEEGVCFLGTVTSESADGERTLYRLPPPLGNWAAGLIGHTRRYGSFSPAYFGFCSPRPGYFGVVPLPPPLPTEDEMAHDRAAVRDWQSLNELRIAEIEDASETGSRHEILKIGVVVVDRRALTGEARTTRPGVKVRAKASAAPRPDEADDFVAVDASHVALPMAAALTLTGAITYRLPPPLAAWVLTNIENSELAELFPTEVEFCKLNGGYTADFVDVL